MSDGPTGELVMQGTEEEREIGQEDDGTPEGEDVGQTTETEKRSGKESNVDGKEHEERVKKETVSEDKSTERFYLPRLKCCVWCVMFHVV